MPSNTVPSSPVAPDFAETASIKSGRSSRSDLSNVSRTNRSSISTAATSPQTHGLNNMSNLSLTRDVIPELDDAGADPDLDVPHTRIIYVTEQVSHHPAVSAYFAACPSKHIQMVGVDQISAKVSGTTLRVALGQYNQGVYVKLTGGGACERDPQGKLLYHSGRVDDYNMFWLQGKQGFRVIIEYKGEVRVYFDSALSTASQGKHPVMVRQAPLFN